MNQNQVQGEPCPSPANYQLGPYQTQPPGHNLMKDRQGHPGKDVPPQGETMSRGDGFWRRCCAGLCCYCCLDMCF
ncbi:hypothetical protein CIPAW_15G117700 [Carya illinoinensis]|uniref:Cysteine-rich transmembrane CYSTM domain-containing protein n=2 Tax=Carya illinoinensis TaxID=32201 RepID=A0A8T1NBV4_CARIL|nr:hypothetical protein CIPAW_15G117700 [Carya illinoinensis]